MAQGKKSFVAYSDWKDIFNELPDEDAGKLIKHVFAYVNDENPVSDSVLIKAVFATIKSTLKRDLDKWDKELEQRKEAGIKSGISRRTKTNERSTVVNETERKRTDSVSVNVNDINNTNKHSFDWDELIYYFNNATGKKCRVVPSKVKDSFKARLKEGYTKEDIANAITNCANSDFHKGNNHKNLTFEFISRSDKIDMYANIKPKQSS